MVYNNEESGDKSAFNEGKLQIGRLNNSLLSSNLKSTQDDLTSWNLELDVIWRELHRDADRLNKSYNKFLDNVDKQIVKCYTYTSDCLGKELKINNRKLLRSLLNLKEIFLRKIQDESFLRRFL